MQFSLYRGSSAKGGPIRSYSQISGGHFILPASLRHSMREASSSPWQANVPAHLGNSLFEVGTSAQCKTSQFEKERCNLPEPAVMRFT